MSPKVRQTNVASNQKKDTFLNIVLIGIRVIAILFTVYLLYKFFPSNPSSAVQFTLRPLHIPGILSIVLLLVLLIPLNQPKRYSRTTMWFTLYVLAVCVGIGSVLLAGLAANYETFHLWVFLVNIAIVFLGPALFLFVLSYLGKEDIIYRPVTVMALVVPSTLLFALSRSFVTSPSQTTFSSTFGFQQTTDVYSNPLVAVWLSWIYIFAFISFALLFRHYRKVKQPAKKKQTKLLLIAIATPFIFTFIATLVTPLSRYTSLSVYAGDTIEICIMAYAILRYGLFTINPATLADTVLGTMNEAVLTTNDHLEIESANKAATQFFDKPSDQIEGQNIQKVMGQGIADKISQRLTDHETDPLEVDLRVADKVTPTSILTSSIFNSDASIAGHVLVFRDITKERAAKEEVERQVVERTEQVHEEQTKLKTSIDSLSLGFVMIDADNNVILSNDAVNQILGSSAETWTLPGLAGRFDKQFDLESACMEVRQSQKRKYFEKANAGDKILRVFVAPVAYRQGAIGLVVLMEDVTEEEILNRSKDEFFSIASHELRTPLTAIRGNASMIMSFYEEQLKDPQMKEMVYDIHESSTRLIDIVNDFLDVSRLEQGKVTYTFEEVSLEEIVENIMYEMKAVLREKHLTLDFSNKTLGSLPKVWADKNRLKQVIYNLVGNAAKFTEKGGITLQAIVEKDYLKILVIDTGRGISADGQKLLFHKFQQTGESLLTRDTTRGTGLGLYISKMMVESMGGNVALEHSEVGKGTTFSFTVPLATEERKKMASEVVRTDSATGLSQVVQGSSESDQALVNQPASPAIKGEAVRLLIVEDDPYVVRLYQRLFSVTKLEVKSANNGAEGIKLAKSFKPHLILLDIMMPVMNGLEALDKLKADADTKDIPVIILSSFGEDSTVKTAMAKGAAAYLVKSDFTPEQVLDEVKKVLKIDMPITPK